tara:strand:+ start:3642 stop:5216 length:1575 start_codon:yes stop_codon:yes gene_type:complete
MTLIIKNSTKRNHVLIIFSLFFVIFLFTSDGHRYTFDEDVAAQQSKRMATLSPDPSYIQDESRMFFEYPWLFPPEQNTRPICQNAILCSHGTIIHSLTQVPFIFVNHHFQIITDEAIWTIDDFDDYHYISWRNSADPDFTFMEIFYGPFFSSLTVSVFFLIAKSYKFSIRTSLILTVLFGLSTIVWAYSQTSLSSVPVTFILLSGFFYYRKFLQTNSNVHLLLTGILFGISFLTRNDMILIFIPFFIFLLIKTLKRNLKIKTLFTFIIPLSISYLIQKIISFVRVGIPETTYTATTVGDDWASAANSNPYFLNLFGILFSPGAGLFIYVPILFTAFVGFFDFYKKNKSDCILFLSFVSIFAIFYSAGSYWHGFNGWGPRYLLPIVAFVILPLGASIEKRTNFFFKLSVIFLGIAGFIINLMYLLQDVSWFVWGFMGSDERGLYSLARKSDGNVFDLWINPVIIWTFEFSQIIQSSLYLFSKPQLDIFLLKILGIELFVTIFVISVVFLSFLLVKSIKISSLRDI